MDSKELDNIIKNHKYWIEGEGGQRADLQGAYLRGAYLRGAYLQGANLRGADLQGAYLQGADLRGADLRGAYLRGADLQGANLRGADLQGAYLRSTIYEKVNWLYLIGILPNSDGKARAYKVTDSKGEGVYNGGINYATKERFRVPKVDKDPYTHCSYGVNLANLAWCLNEYLKDRRLFLMEFSTSPRNCVCPIGSDGKFRVKSCVKIGECNWRGELLK